MTQFLLVLAVALTVGAIVFGVIALLSGDDEGLSRAEPDGRAVPLPTSRPLSEPDVVDLRFDTALRGYRMGQVDAALRRIAYDVGYKEELIKVLQAEIDALREGRFPDAEVLRRAREAALARVEDPSTEEPLVEESSVEEPSVEEPSVEEPSVEEPSAGEAPAEEASAEKASGGEASTEEASGGEASAEEAPAAGDAPEPEPDAADQTAISTEAAATETSAAGSTPATSPRQG